MRIAAFKLWSQVCQEATFVQAVKKHSWSGAAPIVGQDGSHPV
jgi:hypothetical protein